ncbi:response regulator [Thiocapsa sp.]|uniref:response regulator n=1 Tax=Thiocapsa sp. TaxID=2024551 RepID=UPI00345A807D
MPPSRWRSVDSIRASTSRSALSTPAAGWPTRSAERLFEPLFSTKAKQRGHGLGMFMVQEFVMRSGAGLAVSSQVGRGTEFRLLMPIDHQESQQLDLTASSNAPSTKPLLRVLVVDDDPRVRDSVGRLLMLDGMLVSFAENGQDALDRLRRDADFDLVLSDLAMPVLDGAALCAALAQSVSGSEGDPDDRPNPVGLLARGLAGRAARAAQTHRSRRASRRDRGGERPSRLLTLEGCDGDLFTFLCWSSAALFA